MSSTRPLIAILLFIAGVSLFTSMDAVSKLLSANLPIAQISWARFTSHTVAMLAIGCVVGFRRMVVSHRLKLQLARGAIMFLGNVLIITAVSYMALADAIAISFVAPLIVVLLAIPILGETVGLRRILAVATGFAGVLLILRPGSGVFDWVGLLPLGMACCFAGYQLISRVLGRQAEPALVSLFYTGAVGTVLITPVVPFFWVEPSLGDWLLMAMIGPVGMVGHILVFRAFAFAPASVLSPFVYFQLITATGFGYVLFGDFPDGWTIAGAAVIAGSGLYVMWRETRLRPRAAVEGPRAVPER